MLRGGHLPSRRRGYLRLWRPPTVFCWGWRAKHSGDRPFRRCVFSVGLLSPRLAEPIPLDVRLLPPPSPCELARAARKDRSGRSFGLVTTVRGPIYSFTPPPERSQLPEEDVRVRMLLSFLVISRIIADSILPPRVGVHI